MCVEYVRCDDCTDSYRRGKRGRGGRGNFGGREGRKEWVSGWGIASKERRTDRRTGVSCGMGHRLGGMESGGREST